MTSYEVWTCAVGAVGLGFISYASIHGMQALGLTIITKSLTKIITRFAGPIGAAIMIAEFSFCVYDSAQD